MVEYVEHDQFKKDILPIYKRQILIFRPGAPSQRIHIDILKQTFKYKMFSLPTVYPYPNS